MDPPSPPGMHDMQYWQQRCSICFDAACDFCLDRCRDQFCRGCFNRYVSEVVKASWGIAQVKIKCPVCNEVLSKGEWSRVSPRLILSYMQFVNRDVTEQFEKNSRPYKALRRACPGCLHEHELATVFEGSTRDREAVFDEIYAQLSEMFCGDADFLALFQSLYRRHLFGSEGTESDIHATEIYHFVVNKIKESECMPAPVRAESLSKRRRTDRSPTRIDTTVNNTIARSAIAAKLLSLEARPEMWRDLQFFHIAQFPKCECTECRAKFCFQCGEATWHSGISCHDWIARTIATNDTESLKIDTAPGRLHGDALPTPVTPGWVKIAEKKWQVTATIDADTLSNLKWKLEHTKACPRCCILINREEGCNKVDCTMCGHRFCWVCRGAWSERCGFFKCRLEPTASANTSADTKMESPGMSSSPSNTFSEPEIGVPDVAKIHARVAPPSPTTAVPMSP